jgi:hypothetical protein
MRTGAAPPLRPFRRSLELQILRRNSNMERANLQELYISAPRDHSTSASI